MVMKISSTKSPLMMRGIFLFLFAVLISSAVFASSDWLEFQKYYNRAGFQDPSYDGHYQNKTLSIHETSFGSATPFQYLAGDYLNDSRNYLLQISDTTFRIVNVTSNQMVTVYEKTYSSIYTQPWSGDIDSDGRDEIVFTNQSHIFTVAYNGSTMNTLFSNDSYGAITGIACKSISGVFHCYMGNSSGYLYDYIPATGLISAHAMGGIGMFNISGPERFISPAIVDIDNSGVEDVIFVSDPDGDTLDGWVAIDTTSFTNTTVKADSSSGGLKVIKSLLVYNLNGAGNYEVCQTVGTTSGADYTKLVCFKSDGTAYGTAQTSSPGDGVFVPKTMGLAMCEIDGDGQKEICTVGALGSTNKAVTGYCFEAGGDALTSEKTISFPNYGIYYSENSYTQIACADMDGDNYDDVVFPGIIWYPHDESYTDYTSKVTQLDWTFDEKGSATLAVFNDDILTLCHSGDQESYCLFSDFTNSIPNLTDTFGRNYDNPVCNNTPLRFSAKEYDESAAQFAGTNYYNDIDTDTERLAADCYGNGTLYYGSYSLADPYVDCNYTSPGTYNVKIYLQDSYNSADLTQYDDDTVLVVSGSTPGITCNVDSTPVGEDSLDATVTTTAVNPTNTGVQSFFDYLTGGDDNSKIFIGFMVWLIIVIAVGMGIAQVTHSGAAVAIMCGLAGIVGFVVLAAIGLFPLWLLILVFLFLALGAVVVFGVMKGGS